MPHVEYEVRTLDLRDQFVLAKRADDADPVAHYNFGHLRRAQGRFDDAASAYSRALELAPRLLPDRSALASLLTDRTPDLAEGPVTWRWIYSFYVYPNTLVKIRLTGAQIMERSSDVTREVVLIIQAIIILMVTAERLLPLIQAWWRRRRPPEEIVSRAESKEAADVL